MRRGAFSMPEMMIALLVSASLLGLLTATVSRVVIADGAARDHLENLVSVAQLGERFRGDVHAAQSAAVEKQDGQTAKLRLDLGQDEIVEYEIEPGGLRRTVFVDGRAWHREMYAVPNSKILGWNDDFNTSRRLQLRIGRMAARADEAALPIGEFSIDAAIAVEERLRGE